MGSNPTFPTMQDKIAIIIPTVNRDTLRRAVDSVLAQTCDNYHIIIVGDGVMPYVEPSLKITVMEAPWTGEPGFTRNEGVKCASGFEWIGFLDDDDILNQEYVEHWAIRKENDIDILIYKMINRNHVNHTTFIVPNNKRWEYGQVGVNFAIRKPKFDAVEGFKSMKELGSNEDWDFLDRVNQTGLRKEYLDYVGYVVRP